MHTFCDAEMCTWQLANAVRNRAFVFNNLTSSAFRTKNNSGTVTRRFAFRTGKQKARHVPLAKLTLHRQGALPILAENLATKPWADQRKNLAPQCRSRRCCAI
ncbi:hypothetical protein TRVL_09965 [Trypanosoma vivax]|nr:hypothetical protein TRVL_09965 [Trypanosoma vivax]